KVIICTVPPPVTFVWDCSKFGRNNSSRFVVGRADSQLLQVCFECFGPGQIISNLMPIRSYHCAKTGSNSDSNNNHQKRFSHKHYWTPRMVECAIKILKTCIIGEPLHQNKTLAERAERFTKASKKSFS